MHLKQLTLATRKLSTFVAKTCISLVWVFTQTTREYNPVLHTFYEVNWYLHVYVCVYMYVSICTLQFAKKIYTSQNIYKYESSSDVSVKCEM